MCGYNLPYIMRFSHLVPWKHDSAERVLSGHHLGKPSDVYTVDYINTRG